MSMPSKEAFRAVQGESFKIEFEKEAEMVLSLDEVQAKEHLDDAETENFFLIFSSDDERRLQQGAYPVNHEKLGVHFIFLVQVGIEKGRNTYQAIFSRRKDDAPVAP